MKKSEGRRRRRNGRSVETEALGWIPAIPLPLDHDFPECNSRFCGFSGGHSDRAASNFAPRTAEGRLPVGRVSDSPIRVKSNSHAGQALVVVDAACRGSRCLGSDAGSTGHSPGRIGEMVDDWTDHRFGHRAVIDWLHAINKCRTKFHIPWIVVKLALLAFANGILAIELHWRSGSIVLHWLTGSIVLCHSCCSALELMTTIVDLQLMLLP